MVKYMPLKSTPWGLMKMIYPWEGDDKYGLPPGVNKNGLCEQVVFI